ncbi:oxidative DNA demethylase [Phlyctochytrium planicorne]|nr:oxidative DNA demethylase [Phlyctochytrium planicorne]
MSLQEPGLSKQQFRWKIFESLKEDGITDRLKSQLRAHIVGEIRRHINGDLPTTRPKRSEAKKHVTFDSTGKDGTVEIPGELQRRISFDSIDSVDIDADPAKPKPGNLMVKVVESLIIDYLRAKGREFTLSVFMPECGLTRPNQVFAEQDIVSALQLDQNTTLLRKLREQLGNIRSSSVLVRILSSLSKVGSVPVMEKECQTLIDEEEYLEMQIRRADRDASIQSRETSRSMAKAIEERMLRYQNELDLRMRAELEQQLAKFKEIEVASMRVEERQKYTIEITHVKGDYEARMLEQRERLADSNDEIRRKLDAREKEIERNNLEFRQKVLDETNRAIMTERNHRSEAELAAKSLTLERDSLLRRMEEAKSEISELHGFKERYTAKMQEAMSQYKIDLNKEHAGIIQSAQVERAKVESTIEYVIYQADLFLSAEKLVLEEKTKAVEQMLAQVKESQSELEELRSSLKQTKLQLEEASRERDDAIHETKELRLMVSFVIGESPLNCSRQLVDAEKMAVKRQEDYQSLLKSLMGPKEEAQKELVKARKGEQKWQRQCSELVAKLDAEMNRADEFQRKYDDEVIRNKELLREISDLRNVLHQTRTAMGVDQQNLGDAIKSLANPRSALPDPYGLDGVYNLPSHPLGESHRQSPQPFHSPSLFSQRPQGSIPHPYQFPSPTRSAPTGSPGQHPRPGQERQTRFDDAWSQGYERMETLMARSGGLAGLDPRELSRILAERDYEARRYDPSGWDWIPKDGAQPPSPRFTPHRSDPYRAPARVRLEETLRSMDEETRMLNEKERQNSGKSASSKPLDEVLPIVEGIGSGFADDIMQSFSAETAPTSRLPSLRVQSPHSTPPLHRSPSAQTDSKSKAATAAAAILANTRSQLPIPSSSASSSPKLDRKSVQKSPGSMGKASSGSGKAATTSGLVISSPSESMRPPPSQAALKESPTTSLEDEGSKNSSGRGGGGVGRYPSSQRPPARDEDDSISSSSQSRQPRSRDSTSQRKSTTQQRAPPPAEDPATERSRRDQERKERERLELERIRREREEMMRKQEEAEEMLRRAQEDERVERERREAEERERRERDEEVEREKREKREREKREEEEKMRKIEELEQDPTMQKYMNLVKERREKEAQAKKQESSSQQPKQFLDSLQEPSVDQSRQSSFNFGGGDTIDDISGGHTASNTSDPW